MRSLLAWIVLPMGISGLPAVGAAQPAKPTAAGVQTEDELRKGGFMPLVENDSLGAWDVRPWHEGHWVIRDGMIDYDGKAEHKRFQKNSLWSKADFGDLMLYAEWRLPSQPEMKPHPIVLFNADFLLDDNNQRVTRPRLDAGDSGILFRGALPCQANIWSQELGSGEINGYRTNRRMPQAVRRACIPLEKADRPLGEWNAFLITLTGDQMTVELNGIRVINAARLPDAPQAGPIGLQHHGDPVQFRRLWVRRIE